MTVKQLLVLYTTVFMLLIAAVVVTLAGLSLVQAAQQAYRRALTDELRSMARLGSISAVQNELARRPKNAAVDWALVWEQPQDQIGMISQPLIAASPPAYLIARYDPAVAFSIAVVELTRDIVPWAIMGALACAGLLSFMTSRLFLPQLALLAEIARDPSLGIEASLSESVPNEVAEVAQSFRLSVRQLREQHQQLAQMQVNLMRASKLASVGRLAAGVAHEIGNPLAAVRGYLSLLPRLDESEKKEVLARSERELTRMHDTIRKLLAYARPEDPAGHIEAISIGAVVTEAWLLVRGHPALRAVTIEDHTGSGGNSPPQALGDARHLEQVLVNLVLNAGQALTAVPQAKICLDLRVGVDWIELDVMDNGPGIAVDQHAHIFEPFYTTKSPGEGTGLGLAISRTLMEGMNGDLGLRDAPGGGACFTLRLARAPMTVSSDTPEIQRNCV